MINDREKEYQNNVSRFNEELSKLRSEMQLLQQENIRLNAVNKELAVTSNDSVQKQIDYINLISDKDHQIENLNEQIRQYQIKLSSYNDVNILESNYDTVSRELSNNKQELSKLQNSNYQLKEQVKKLKTNCSTQKQISMKYIYYKNID